MNPRARVLTFNFAVLSSVTLCYFLSMAMLIPVFTKYMDSLGFRPSQVGFAFGAVSFTAIVFRPFAGREMDARGRKLFMSVGLIFSIAACAAYPFVIGFAAIVGVRLLHGVAISCFYPSASTLTADISPPERRAEALSYFSMFLYAGSAAGPALGEFTIARAGFAASFLTASALATLGLLIAGFLLKEPPHTQAPAGRSPLLNRAAAFPAAILALSAIASSAASVFIPLYAAAEGDGDSRYFFLAQSVAVIIVRSFVGKIADRYGRAAAIIPGTLSCSVAMVVLAMGASQTYLVVGALVFGLGWGMLFPGLLAITIDRVPENQRGSATGTLTSAFDASFGISAVVLGLVLEIAGFPAVFLIGAVGAAAATAAFLVGRKRSEAAFPALAQGLAEPQAT